MRHNLYHVALASKLPVPELLKYLRKVRPSIKDVDAVGLKEHKGKKPEIIIPGIISSDIAQIRTLYQPENG